ncbi:MAG: hypothetical protein KGJ98_01780 [Chloroflexota bacterium]|nr:hypothetical protein [Chloroflexota bacterium]MDE3100944.1 hypothetical protein [Chloroflexota bacterium]
MDDDVTRRRDAPVSATQTLLLGVFTTFLALAFVLLLIGDQVSAHRF